MSVKLQNTRNLLRKNLQGLMESKRIPNANVEELVENPAELQKLLSTGGDQFDSQTKAAIAQLLGGVASPKQKLSTQKSQQQKDWMGQSAYAAKSPYSLLIGEKASAQKKNLWFASVQASPLEIAPEFKGRMAASVEVGTTSFSVHEVEDFLRSVSLRPVSETPFVDAELLLSLAKKKKTLA